MEDGETMGEKRRTMGISSLASVSYCLRRVGRSAGGEDGYTDAKRPAALMREGKFSPPASRFTSGNISFCTRSSPIAAATVTSDATACGEEQHKRCGQLQQ
eukprot:2331303-Rhodomonas_salina.1